MIILVTRTRGGTLPGEGGGVVLRVRFCVDDMAKVSLSVAMHSETLGSVQAVQSGVVGIGPIEDWVQSAQRSITDEMGPLFDVVPARGAIPDFLTPERGSAGDSTRLVKTISSLAPHAVRGQLARLDRVHTPWLRKLDDGESRALRDLGGALAMYHERCVKDFLPVARLSLDVEIARRAAQLAEGGVGRFLETLGPSFRWRSPVLEVDCLFRGDLVLGGRGIRFVPSVTWPRVALAVNGYDKPTLVYPVRPTVITDGNGGSGLEGLRQALGPTRAQILLALTEPSRTTDLAARVGTSLSSASEHTSVLRRVGLVDSERQGKAVVHRLTGLGRALLTRDLTARDSRRGPTPETAFTS